MWWILIALLSPLLYASTNIIDGFLANRRMPDIFALLFYASLFNLVFLPVIFLIDPFVLPSPWLCFVMLLIGAANVLYLYPYYRSLQTTDTSIVISLFSLANIMVPLGAYLFLGERLSPWQYAGFATIVLASTLLTFDPKKFRLTPAFGLMLAVSLLVTLQSMGFKYLFNEGMGWGTALGGTSLSAFICAVPLLFVPRIRKRIIDGWEVFRGSLPLFAFEEAVAFGASAAATYAIMLVPLTLEKTVEAFQPVFVLAFALVFARFFPRWFKEKIDRSSLAKKTVLFVVMGIGIWLMS
jgi:drug/metabolite transporter (DMT)-like permease